ncbi:MAG: hypothetical protein LBQ38_02155 [Spirochaetaceae bacterium]|nr:hypothetical protein [Spirochaetaceae bacterium]
MTPGRYRTVLNVLDNLMGLFREFASINEIGSRVTREIPEKSKIFLNAILIM